MDWPLARLPDFHWRSSLSRGGEQERLLYACIPLSDCNLSEASGKQKQPWIGSTLEGIEIVPGSSGCVRGCFVVGRSLYSCRGVSKWSELMLFGQHSLCLAGMKRLFKYSIKLWIGFLLQTRWVHQEECTIVASTLGRDLTFSNITSSFSVF